MSDGAPTFGTKRIVAVRGNRLAMAHHEIVLSDNSSTELLILFQLDPDCDLTERVIIFDVDDEAAAIATLDELAASLGEQDISPPGPAR